MEDHQTKLALLQASLSAAVPIEAENLRRLPLDQVLDLARKSAATIAEKGDIILYKSNKPGATAQAFAALARGVAAASFAPGGVKLFGLHFESKHPSISG